MNKFGIEEIHAIRARWAEMPREEYRAEQKRLLAGAMRRMYGEDWKAAYAARTANTPGSSPRAEENQ